MMKKHNIQTLKTKINGEEKMKTKVKAFSSHDIGLEECAKELEKKINKWLKKSEKDSTLVEIQYQESFTRKNKTGIEMVIFVTYVLKTSLEMTKKKWE